MLLRNGFILKQKKSAAEVTDFIFITFKTLISVKLTFILVRVFMLIYFVL